PDSYHSNSCSATCYNRFPQVTRRRRFFMLALFAIIMLAPLLYLPGYLIAYALLGAAQPTDALERHYERVAAGALLNGWLALTLAELGIFSAWLHLMLLLAICFACAIVARRRGALRLPTAPLGIVPRGSSLIWRSSPGPKTKDQGRKSASEFVFRPWSLVAHWETIGFIAVGLVFVLLVARPFEVVLGARDAGVYTNSGYAIANSGGIAQYDRLVQQIAADQKADDPTLRDAAAQAETNFLGNQAASRFIATRLRLSGFQIWSGDLANGRVVPQFLHMYPAWIALLTSLLGLHGGLLATSLLGFLGVWSVAMLGRRLAGPWVGLLGGLFLALNGVQVWFSRYSTSEACAQFLCFAALYGFAIMQEPKTENQEPGTDHSGSQFSVLGSRAGFGGLLAGVAAGQLALTRIDFFVLLAPLLVYLAYMALTRRWSAALWALAAGLGAMLVHALLHIVFISRAYFLDTLYARLQDQSAIVARLGYPLLEPGLGHAIRGDPTQRGAAQPVTAVDRAWAGGGAGGWVCAAPPRRTAAALVRERGLALPARAAARGRGAGAAAGVVRLRHQTADPDAIDA